MEIPRHWRLKAPRYRLEGFRIIRKDGTVDYEFPPMANPKKPIEVYNCKIEAQKSGFLPPDDQVVHGEVVRQDQEQDDKS